MRRERYFAYGSNMHPEQFRSRIASATALGRAQLADWRLACNKLGRDRSAKANLVRCAGGLVWGALYEMDGAELSKLDSFEGGYERIRLAIRWEQPDPVEAHVYVSELLTDDPVPFLWYKRRLVEGARAHGLPDDYLRVLEALPARTDPQGTAR